MMGVEHIVCNNDISGFSGNCCGIVFFAAGKMAFFGAPLLQLFFLRLDRFTGACGFDSDFVLYMEIRNED